MRWADKSDRGLLRENNEDYLLADGANGIFLLADGMGGGPAGEVASELAVTAAHQSLLRHLAGVAAPTAGRLLAKALAAAHSAVARRALAEPALEGMGTTLEIVLILGATALLCHLGDSRVYLFRQESLRQLTTDDNYAAVLAEVEKIPKVRIPPRYRHVLTQVVGLSKELMPEISSIDLKPADLLLVCSDGLNEALGDDEIRSLLVQNREDLVAITEALVAAANDQGGADNVSVVVIEPIPALRFAPAVMVSD